MIGNGNKKEGEKYKNIYTHQYYGDVPLININEKNQIALKYGTSSSIMEFDEFEDSQINYRLKCSNLAHKNETADDFCINCKKFLCNECLKDHEQNECLKDHGQEKHEIIPSKLSSTYQCQNKDCRSKNKSIKHYCLDCNKHFCADCIENHISQKSHQSIEFTDIISRKEMADNFGDRLKNKKADIIKNFESIKRTLKDLKDIIKKYERIFEEMKESLEKWMKYYDGLYDTYSATSKFKNFNAIKNLWNTRLNEFHDYDAIRAEINKMKNEFIWKSNELETNLSYTNKKEIKMRELVDLSTHRISSVIMSDEEKIYAYDGTNLLIYSKNNNQIYSEENKFTIKIKSPLFELKKNDAIIFEGNDHKIILFNKTTNTKTEASISNEDINYFGEIRFNEILAITSSFIYVLDKDLKMIATKKLDINEKITEAVKVKGDKLITISEQRRICLWSLIDYTKLKELNLDLYYFAKMDYIEDSDTLVLRGGKDGKSYYIIDIEQFKIIHEFRIEDDYKLFLSLKNGSFIFRTPYDKLVQFEENFEKISEKVGDNMFYNVASISLGPNNQFIIGTHYGTIRIFKY